MREVLDTRFFAVHYTSKDAGILDRTRGRLAQLRRERRGLIPAIVVAETAYFVCREGGKQKALASTRAMEVSGLDIVPLDAETAREAGLLKCTYRDVPMADCIIAATALREDGCVVSNDPHFSRIKGLRVTWV